MTEAALNACINLAVSFIEKWDPTGFTELHSDGVLCIKLEPLPVLYFDFSVLKIVEKTENVRATIQSSAIGFFRYFIENENKNVHISGDILWLKHIIETIKSLDVSFADLLASVFPHPIAGPAAHFLQTAYTFSKKNQHTIEEKLINFLLYEKEWLASKKDIQLFVTEVDSALLRAERIEARIANLEGKL